jgi:hypothetical protein
MLFTQSAKFWGHKLPVTVIPQVLPWTRKALWWYKDVDRAQCLLQLGLD